MWKFIKFSLFASTIGIDIALIVNFINDYIKCACLIAVVTMTSLMAHRFLDMYEPVPTFFRKIIELKDDSESEN